MKWIIRGVLLLVVLVVVALLGVFFFTNPILRKSVEAGGSYALGVDTKLEGVRLGLFSGELSLTGFNVGNPQGFQTSHFLALKTGKVKVSLGSLTQDKVVVPLIELEHIDVNLEKLADKANYAVILENLQKLSDPEAKPPEEAPGKGFVIEQLRIAGVSVHAKLGGRNIDVTIPEIPLSNLGADSDTGLLLSEVSGIVVKAILDAVVANAGNLIPAELLGELQGGLAAVGQIGDYTAGKIEEVSAVANEMVEEAAGKVEEAVGDATKQVGEGLDEATKKLGEGVESLFGDKK